MGAAAAAAVQHNAHNLRTPKHGGRYRYGRRRGRHNLLLHRPLLLLLNTTRTTSGPPSTGASITIHMARLMVKQYDARITKSRSHGLEDTGEPEHSRYETYGSTYSCGKTQTRPNKGPLET